MCQLINRFYKHFQLLPSINTTDFFTSTVSLTSPTTASISSAFSHTALKYSKDSLSATEVQWCLFTVTNNLSNRGTATAAAVKLFEVVSK